MGLGNLTVGGASSLDSNAALGVGNNVVLNANLTAAGSNNLTLGGMLSGTGALIKDGAANLTLNGVNTWQGGTTLNAGTLTLGNGAALGGGALTVAGASTLDNSAALVLANNLNLNAGLEVAGNNNLTLAGIVAGSGSLIKSGLADLTLVGNNTFSGTFDVLAGSLSTLSGTALGTNAAVNLAAGSQLNLGASASLASLGGNGTALVGAGNMLSIGASNSSSTFAGALTGTGMLDKLGSGTLSLAGSNSLTGDTRINAGTLDVSGSLASGNVLVNSGATLSGSGSLAGAVNVADGGHLGAATGSTLSLGSLVLAGNSNLDVGLGVPVSGGGNALVNVGGDLTLDGTLNVSDIGGFGSGVYRLINYTGGLTDNGLLVGSVPGSVTPGDLQVQTAIGSQVNLLVTAPGTTVQFWDGSQLVADGAINGGSGTWGQAIRTGPTSTAPSIWGGPAASRCSRERRVTSLSLARKASPACNSRLTATRWRTAVQGSYCWSMAPLATRRCASTRTLPRRSMLPSTVPAPSANTTPAPWCSTLRTATPAAPHSTAASLWWVMTWHSAAAC